MDVGVVGGGGVGTALAVLLQRAGHRIVGVSGGAGTHERAARHLPGVPVFPPEDVARGAEVVILGTPDGAIEPTCTALSRAGALGPGQTVTHLSGATGLDALGAAEAAGAEALCVHPLMTCPDVDAAVARIPGSAFAVTARSPLAFQVGERIALDVGGRPFALEDGMKPLYHAAAVFASNYLVTLTALAASLEDAARVPDPLGALAPLQQATLENVIAAGPEAALTGPAVRGDDATVERNLRALAEHAPHAVPAYVALADLALELAVSSGRLDARAAAAVKGVLERWR
jgi:predicted short-subunit dehydrogenase-like oxidoreductase (DUF2520 family)